MPKNLDVHRLIGEIKKRPTLWNVKLPQYKDRTQTMRLWLEVAEILGCDVELCKRKWKNLRDAYRAEVRRTERRLLRLKMEGQSDPQVSDSKWVYFKPMSFMNMIKRKSVPPGSANASSSPKNFSNDSHHTFTPEAPEHIDMDSYFDVKMEPPTSTDDEVDLSATGDGETSTFADDDDEDMINYNNNYHEIEVLGDDEDANDILFEQFKSVATPQAARRVSGSLSMGTGVGSDISSQSPRERTTSAADATVMATSTQMAPISGNTTSSTSASHASTCKCSEQAEDQVHFLEDLEREEKKLMQSTRRDISRASNLTHFGDSDYNFLVSFLPQMKRLSELQNLQFRAKMSDLMLRIMAQPMAPVKTIPSATFGCTSTTNSCPQGHFDCTTSSAMATTAQQKCHQQQNH